MYRPGDRGPAMAAFSALSGIAATAGPVLGPALLSWNLAGQSWRLVFWVNVPVGGIAAITAARLLPADTGSGHGRLDLPGVVVAGAGLGLVLYPLIAASGHGQWPVWASPVIAAGVVVLAVFCLQQRWTAARGGQPLLDLSLFARRSLKAGLTMLPWSVSVTVFAGLSATVLLPRIGRLTVQLGLVLTAAGLVLMSFAAADASGRTGTLALLPGILADAAGMGLVVAPIAQLTLADVAASEAGTGSGLFNTVSQLGASIGVAAIGTLFFTPGRELPTASANQVGPSPGRQQAGRRARRPGQIPHDRAGRLRDWTTFSKRADARGFAVAYPDKERSMAVVGKLLKNRRAGQAGLAWNSPNLAGADSLALRSPDFENEGTIPAVHTAKRAGGKDLSPALTWSPAPEGTVQLLLVIEDPDAPTGSPFVHCVALLEPPLTGLPQGALDATEPAAGVRVLRSGMGRGYMGPAPIKGHGPHRYVFQLFALAKPVTAGRNGAALDSAKPRDVLAAAGDVLARGRLDGCYERE